jgi:hypothetical protein
MTTKQRQCRCGAIYHRTEAMAASREIDSFECTACGVTLEKWDTAWVPTYRRIAAPAIEITAPAIEITKPAIEITEIEIEPDKPADARAQTADRNAIPPRRS